jgi:hypothetical protein
MSLCCPTTSKALLKMRAFSGTLRFAGTLPILLITATLTVFNAPTASAPAQVLSSEELFYATQDSSTEPETTVAQDVNELVPRTLLDYTLVVLEKRSQQWSFGWNSPTARLIKTGPTLVHGRAASVSTTALGISGEVESSPRQQKPPLLVSR